MRKARYGWRVGHASGLPHRTCTSIQPGQQGSVLVWFSWVYISVVWGFTSGLSLALLCLAQFFFNAQRLVGRNGANIWREKKTTHHGDFVATVVATFKKSEARNICAAVTTNITGTTRAMPPQWRRLGGFKWNLVFLWPLRGPGWRALAGCTACFAAQHVSDCLTYNFLLRAYGKHRFLPGKYLRRGTVWV